MKISVPDNRPIEDFGVDKPICAVCGLEHQRSYKTILGGSGNCCGLELIHICSEACMQNYLKAEIILNDACKDRDES